MWWSSFEKLLFIIGLNNVSKVWTKQTECFPRELKKWDKHFCTLVGQSGDKSLRELKIPLR